MTTTLAPARPNSSHIAAPMPRLPPVTTATAPCKFKTASLSVEFASEPGESYCRSRPGANYVYKAHKHTKPRTTREPSPESGIALLPGCARPLPGPKRYNPREEILTEEHIYVNCIYY